MSGVTGSFAELDALAKKIASVDGAEFRRGFTNALGAAAISHLDEQFDKAKDPYGNPWLPLKQRQGKPLSDTGRLASSYTHHEIPNGFRIETVVAYAATHQYGATIVPVVAKRLAWKVRGGGWRTSMKSVIPKRQMVPEQSTGGLGEWGKVLNDEADAFLKTWVGVT